MSEPTGGPINHPKHYNDHPSGVECIVIVRHMNFNIGNVFKYLWRAGLKNKAATLEDHKKALWYLQDEITRLERETKSPLIAPDNSPGHNSRDES